MTHSLLYLLPSLPHTGSKIFLQGIMHFFSPMRHFPLCTAIMASFFTQDACLITHSLAYVLP